MKTTILLFLLFFSLITNVSAQHQIYFKNQRIVKVYEIAFEKKTVLARAVDKNDSPPNEIPKSVIEKIIFSDGKIAENSQLDDLVSTIDELKIIRRIVNKTEVTPKKVITSPINISSSSPTILTNHPIDYSKNLDTIFIWNCKVLKKGFYKTYEEYIHNSPSIIRKFKVVDKSAFSSVSGLGGASGDYKFILEDDEKKVGKHWGLCDGQKVFVDLSVNGSKQLFWPLDFIGKNPSFTYIYHAGLLTTILNAATDGVEMFINDKGRFENATVNNLKKLFASEPDILKAFSEEPEIKSKRKEYIRKFNEKMNQK